MILRVVHDEHADLVLVGSDLVHRSLFHRMVHGTVCRHVLHHSPCPVVVVVAQNKRRKAPTVLQPRQRTISEPVSAAAAASAASAGNSSDTAAAPRSRSVGSRVQLAVQPSSSSSSSSSEPRRQTVESQERRSRHDAGPRRLHSVPSRCLAQASSSFQAASSRAMTSSQ